jgi:hypothetical protein
VQAVGGGEAGGTACQRREGAGQVLVGGWGGTNLAQRDGQTVCRCRTGGVYVLTVWSADGVVGVGVHVARALRAHGERQPGGGRRRGVGALHGGGPPGDAALRGPGQGLARRAAAAAGGSRALHHPRVSGPACCRGGSGEVRRGGMGRGRVYDSGGRRDVTCRRDAV